MSETITLKIGGKAYEGWTSVRVTRAVDSICASFELSLVASGPGQLAPSAIQDQASCELWLGADLFLTGYIDELDDDLSDTAHEIRVSGRDKTAVLVDCSAENSPGSWKNQKLEVIVRALLAPFGLALRVDAPTGAAFPAFALKPGEKAAEAIVRLCKMRGVMLKSNPDGTLVIFTPAAVKAQYTLELGRNIKGRNFRSRSADRYSQYIVKGQRQGTHGVSAKDAAQVKGKASDPGVMRYRPITIITSEQASAAGLKARAQWEATTRMGKSMSLSVPVPGWRNDAGVLFSSGDYPRFLSAYDGLDLTMLVDSVTFSLGTSTTATLELVRPEAYTPEPLLEPKVKKAKKGNAALIAALGDD